MSNSKGEEKWEKISIVFDDHTLAKKILDNYPFSDGLYADANEERRFSEKDSPIMRSAATGASITNVIVLLASIATTIDFILKYFNKNKKGKITLKKGDSEITIDGDYNKEELKEILSSYTEIASNNDVDKYLKIKKYIINQEISSLNSNIKTYQELSEVISKKYKDRAKIYDVRIKDWNERIKFLNNLVDNLDDISKFES